jgi:hypothetical protein
MRISFALSLNRIIKSKQSTDESNMKLSFSTFFFALLISDGLEGIAEAKQDSASEVSSCYKQFNGL